MDEMAIYNNDGSLIVSNLYFPSFSGTPRETECLLYFMRNKKEEFKINGVLVRITTATGLISGDTDINGQDLIDNGQVQIMSSGVIGDIEDDEGDWETITTSGIFIGGMKNNTARRLYFRILDPGSIEGDVYFRISFLFIVDRVDGKFFKFDIDEKDKTYYNEKYYNCFYYN
jgi:hypothetical protein